MSGLKIFKLIVQPSLSCMELLKYLDKHIEDVNHLGAGVQIEKISKTDFDEEMVELLRKNGITRLPAMFTPDGQLFIGLKQVVNIFDKNLNNMKNKTRLGWQGGNLNDPALDAEVGNNPDMTSFWMKEMFSGVDGRGKLIPRKDKDESDDENKDIERRLADYRRHTPEHRRATTERNIDPAPRHRDAVPDTDDNIADLDEEVPAPRRRPREIALAPTGDAAGDEMDRRMMDALLNKFPHE